MYVKPNENIIGAFHVFLEAFLSKSNWSVMAGWPPVEHASKHLLASINFISLQLSLAARDEFDHRPKQMKFFVVS